MGNSMFKIDKNKNKKSKYIQLIGKKIFHRCLLLPLKEDVYTRNVV